MIKKLVPFSSVLYRIVTNYKFWKVRDISKQDSFYSEYFKRANKYTIPYNVSEQSTLLSGDVELNPGPNVTIQNEISFIDPDFILKYRMLRYGFKPLEVGGGGDCFFSINITSIVWKFRLPSCNQNCRSELTT